MSRTDTHRPRWTVVVAVLAGVFGVATIASGGRVLFGPEAARAAAGDYVPWLVWFNFLAGFVYVGAAVAIGLAHRWAGALSAAIAWATLVACLAFGAHVLSGGAYEARTVGALVLRLGFWAVIAHRRGARTWIAHPDRGGPPGG